MPMIQTCGNLAGIADCDGVGEYPATRFGVGFASDVTRFDVDLEAAFSFMLALPADLAARKSIGDFHITRQIHRIRTNARIDADLLPIDVERL